MAWTRFLLLFCVVIWGWTFVATKICVSFVNPFELIGLRFLIGLPLLFTIIRSQKIPLQFSKRDRPALLTGSTLITVHFLIQAYALQYTTATNTGWLIAVIPLVLAVLSFLILKETLGRATILGITIATAGILLLISKGDFGNINWLSSTGDWLILASAHTWALFTIASRNISRERPPLAVTLFMFLPVTLICGVYLLFTADFSSFSHLPEKFWIALFFLGILGTVTQWFWQIGVAKIGATRAGIFLYIEPIATTVLAVPLLNEPFNIFSAFGAGLVLFGVWWAQRNIIY